MIMTELMPEQPRELYNFVGTPYERPLFKRDGLAIDLDFIPGTLDEVRNDALRAYEVERQAREAQERAEKYREVDGIYETVGAYVDLLESTGWPGGMKLKIVPDGIDAAKSIESDDIDGILWPLVDNTYNNNKEPAIAIGPDRRIYTQWKSGTNNAKMTYTRAEYAPLDLYDKASWGRIDYIRAGLDKLEVPVESSAEIPPEGVFDRNGADLPRDVDIDHVRAEAMTVYEHTQEAAKWAEIKPMVEQVDAIYQDAQLLAKLWRESGMPGATICKVLPDDYPPGNGSEDQFVDAVILPLNDSHETHVKGKTDFVLGPEGRIYIIRSSGDYNKDNRTSSFYYYAPLDLYCVDHIARAKRVAEGLDNASKAKH